MDLRQKSMKIASKLISEATPNTDVIFTFSVFEFTKQDCRPSSFNYTADSACGHPVSVRKGTAQLKSRNVSNVSAFTGSWNYRKWLTQSSGHWFCPVNDIKDFEIEPSSHGKATVKAPSPKKSPVKVLLRRSQRVSPARTVEKSKKPSKFSKAESS